MGREEKEKNNTTAIRINQNILNEYVLQNIADMPKKKNPSPTSPLVQENTPNRNLVPSCYNTVDSDQVTCTKL